ncbi:rCG45244 [Rattus norvegicus]|uniref:RCG45244 n=1 Tax=Rattus norvegicus TaxID=10116 RepID=A6KLD8_RAT|nr:rCG45244 [Rattus norvegicus]
MKERKKFLGELTCTQNCQGAGRQQGSLLTSHPLHRLL